MKTLILNGSPRKHGDTAALLKLFSERMEGEIKIINAYEADIAACIDCRYCKNVPECTLDDGMQDIYRYLAECDNVVIASPVYFGSLTGKLLCLISRLQVYFWAGFFRKEQLIAKPKKGGIILVGGGSGGADTAVVAAKEALSLMRCEEVFPMITSMKTDRIRAMEDEKCVLEVERMTDFFR